ncbi:HNH endonuclease [Flavobacterium sp. UBA4197]|uniref:HNH endonuclease n=1 Tax=Flavobacterium sp. UBA4197 TaxID=1946546 RepID=UPI00257E0784|nr:HNH endonuclease [Flavobacterium sp. UBA4197]
MDICLLCDEPMHNKPNLGIALDPSKKYKHKEHIIQNAIGGRLKSSTILCEACGGILNTEIDIDFTKLFLPFTARINDLAKDRNAKANTRLQGTHIGSNKQVKYVSKTPVPLRPSREINDAEEKVTIYCPKDIIDNFRKSVNKELEEAHKQHYRIDEIYEFSQSEHVWISFSKDVKDFNDKWKMGFIKIATEFAYMHGVPKDQLIKTLDITAKKLIFSNNLHPFVPVTAIDHLLEYNRNIIERNYPSHTLHLYTQSYSEHDKHLICYVELFSTFQYYVVLTDTYNGPEVMQSYSQKIVTEKKIDLDIKELQPKELMQEARSFGINLSNAPDSSMEGVYDYFEKEFAKIQPVYELDLKKELSASLELLKMAILKANLPKSPSQYAGLNDELAAFIAKFSKEDRRKILLETFDFFYNNEDYIIERFRKLYFENDSNGNRDRISMIAKCIQIAAKDIKQVQDYGHEKFSFLSYFLNVQQNIE